jgi:hypothetical protein
LNQHASGFSDGLVVQRNDRDRGVPVAAGDLGVREALGAGFAEEAKVSEEIAAIPSDTLATAWALGALTR